MYTNIINFLSSYHVHKLQKLVSINCGMIMFYWPMKHFGWKMADDWPLYCMYPWDLSDMYICSYSGNVLSLLCTIATWPMVDRYYTHAADHNADWHIQPIWQTHVHTMSWWLKLTLLYTDFTIIQQSVQSPLPTHKLKQYLLTFVAS